jgi:hypothetical protein
MNVIRCMCMSVVFVVIIVASVWITVIDRINYSNRLLVTSGEYGTGQTLINMVSQNHKLNKLTGKVTPYV